MKTFLGLFGALVVGLCVGMTSMVFCPYLSKFVCQAQCQAGKCCPVNKAGVSCDPVGKCCPPKAGKCCCEQAGKTCTCCPGCVQGKDCTCADGKCTCCPCCKGHNKTAPAPKKN